MRRFEAALWAAGLTAALAIGATACGDDSGKSAPATTATSATTFETTGSVVGPAPGTPYPGVLHCTAKSPDKWIQTPDQIDVPRVNQVLKVQVERIDVGKFGTAHCDEAILASQVGSKATVEGIGNTCLVVGLDTQEPPQAGKTYHDVLAVCAYEG